MPLSVAELPAAGATESCRELLLETNIRVPPKRSSLSLKVCSMIVGRL
jgi:hypothetical protein